jgi:hypothetical protein
VYGEASPALAQRCAALGLPLHAFSWSDDCAGAGLQRNALYLVRPDGYVGLAQGQDCAAALVRYATDWGLRFGERAQ